MFANNANDVFERVFADFVNSDYNGVSKYPPTDISYDSDTEIVFVDVALAGFNKDDINIELDGTNLIISSPGLEKEDEHLKYIQKQIAKRGFKRIIKLSDEYTDGEVEASMNNGMLEISITPTQKHKKLIEIK